MALKRPKKFLLVMLMCILLLLHELYMGGGLYGRLQRQYQDLTHVEKHTKERTIELLEMKESEMQQESKIVEENKLIETRDEIQHDTAHNSIDSSSPTAITKEPCALLFFGLMKSFERLALPSFQEKILKHNSHCDIFLHTYDLVETPGNSRNAETAIAPSNITKAYLLTDNVYFETIESFQEKRMEFILHSRNFTHYKPCCNTHDNIIKQWNSIAGAWDLMRQNEIKLTGNTEDHYYKYVALFRTDTYIVSSIPDISTSTAALPEFGSHGGVNDRMFYGSYENAQVWSNRFAFSKTFEQEYMDSLPLSGYHSESYLAKMLEHHNITLEKQPICLWRIRNYGGLTAVDCSDSEYSLPQGYTSNSVGRTKAVPVNFHWSKFWDMKAKPKEWKELDRKFRSQSKDKGVILLSMYESGLYLMAAYLAGAYGFNIGGNNSILIEGKKENLKTLPRQNDAFLWGQGLDWKSNVELYNTTITLEQLNNDSLPIVAGILSLEALTEKSENGPIPWLMNDPQLCITLKSWLSILHTQPATIFLYRNPLEVSRVLVEKGDGPMEKSLLLWIQYNKSAILNSKGLCRVIVEEDVFNENPFDESERIVHELSQNCGVTEPPKKASREFANNFFVQTEDHGKSIVLTDDILQTHKDCKIYRYEIVDHVESSYEKELYIEAMRLYCDLKSGEALSNDYEWPQISEDILRSIFKENDSNDRKDTENYLYQNYVRDCRDKS